MGYRAVLFDLDGTLLDTLEDIADSVNSVLANLGFPGHGIEAYRHFIGGGVEELASRALPEGYRNEATVARLVTDIRQEYGRRWADKTRPYEGIPDLLDDLSSRGVKMAILSNKPDDLTKMTVEALLSRWRFEVIVGAGPSIPAKPNPAAAVAIAESLGVSPDEVLYVGDGDTDMKTAHAAGMYPVGALWGFRTAAELLASGAETLLETPMDLVGLL